MLQNKKIQKNLEFIKIFLFIKLKILKEFKLNSIIGFIPHFIFMGIVSLNYYILKQNFSTIINWNIEQFILFLIFLECFLFIFGYFPKYLRKDLLTGKFNIILNKPINPFLYQAIKSINIHTFMLGAIYMTLFVPYFIYYGIHLQRFLIIFIFAIFGGLLLTTIRIFNNNMAFHMKENYFLNRIYFENFMSTFTSYPPSFFKDSFLSKLIFFLGILYYASLPIDFYFNEITFIELSNQFYILIFLLISINIINYFIWKTGIKKYEGYN